MKDLHIHIEKGPYTEEWIEQFINQAEKMNLTEICLLEHSIRFKDFRECFNEAYAYNNYQKKWIEEKEKSMHTLDEFKALANQIKQNDYSVDVKFGLEVCYFPQHEKLIKQLVDDNNFDYVIGSVHWIDNWTFNQRKYQWINKDVNYLYNRYYELQTMAASSKIFDVIAHPDLINCQNIFPKESMNSNYEMLCKECKNSNVMLEINTSRYWKNKSKTVGINNEFFEKAKSLDVKFSTGSDAHSPADVGKGIELASKRILK